jgi:hypothetical protein
MSFPALLRPLAPTLPVLFQTMPRAAVDFGSSSPSTSAIRTPADRWTPTKGFVLEVGMMLALELAKMNIPRDEIY